MTILQGTNSNIFFAENLEPVAELVLLLSDPEYYFGETDDKKSALFKANKITQSRFVATRSQLEAVREDLLKLITELDKLEEKVKNTKTDKTI
jgi:hypothetical protein